MVEVSKEDSFDIACQRLERLSDLKAKNLIENVKYEELKNLLLSQMMNVVSSTKEEIKEQTSLTEVAQKYSVPYGQLHLQIVKKISASYKNAGGDLKQRMFKALTEMAEKQALYPGDSANIEEIIEISFTPFPDTSIDPEVADKLLMILKSLNDVHSRVKDNPGSSPAAKAIAEITYQSASEAAEQIRTRQNKPELSNTTPQKLWKKWVLEDLWGCVEGGAAAATIFPGFSAAILPLSYSMAIAFGVVVGAGIKSGIAIVS
jgi:hypothetical protein